MAFDEMSGLQTSRRTVVKTGAKLAYAAPLVAATMKLSAGGVLAASPVPCDDPRDPCYTYALNCGGGSCYCIKNVDGGASCTGVGTCAVCATHGDCDAVTGPGSSCVVAECCGGGTACLSACTADDGAVAVGAGPLSR